MKFYTTRQPVCLDEYLSVHAYLGSKLSNEDVLVVKVMPLGDPSLEIGGVDVVPVSTDVVKLQSVVSKHIPMIQ